MIPKNKSIIHLPDGESYVMYCFETGSIIKSYTTSINLAKNLANNNAYTKHKCSYAKSGGK